MGNGTWRQWVVDLFFGNHERKPKSKQISELQKKLSKDKANFQGLGEEE